MVTHGDGRRQPASHGMLPVLALRVAKEYHALRRIPAVTSGLILANTLIYYRPGPLHHLLPSIQRVLFNPHLILKNRDLRRFFLPAFYHVKERHLIYNMMALLLKGTRLEMTMGSVEFASTVAALLTLTQGATIILSKSLILFGYAHPYYNQFSAGFSGVIFALRVVLNARSEYYPLLGLRIPAKCASWTELIFTQLFIPEAPFISHIGGILAGIVYLRFGSSFSGPDPLTLLVTGFVKIVSWPLRFFHGYHGRLSGHGPMGPGSGDTDE